MYSICGALSSMRIEAWRACRYAVEVSSRLGTVPIQTGMHTLSRGRSHLMDIKQAHCLVAQQFPQWKHLAIRPVTLGGHDNRTFHLGDKLLLRFPSAQEYAAQVYKEQCWLPKLRPLLPLPIPEPIGLGQPTEQYPWQWSIYRWLEGQTAASVQIHDQRGLAATLGCFLGALHTIDPQGGPEPGPHNFYRGGALSTYAAETHQALDFLKHQIDIRSARKIWEIGEVTEWQRSSVWVHGDISPANLLVKPHPHSGKIELSAVIDFGMLAVGDPACDLTIAWTMFQPEARRIFRDVLPFDEDVWARARAWGLWKALIVTANMTDTNPVESAQSKRVLTKIIEEYKHNG